MLFDDSPDGVKRLLESRGRRPAAGQFRGCDDEVSRVGELNVN